MGKKQDERKDSLKREKNQIERNTLLFITRYMRVCILVLYICPLCCAHYNIQLKMLRSKKNPLEKSTSLFFQDCMTTSR
jgi:hypothetical protein